MAGTVNTGITISKELLDDFDDVIWELQREGELGRDTSRSEMVQQLMQNYVDDHRDLLDDEGKRNPARTALAD